MRFFGRALITTLAALAVPAAAMAQDTQCHALKYRTNFRLNGASQHLEQAEHGSDAGARRSRLDNALRVLTEASQAGGSDAFTLWFLFGRTYGLRGDLPGADSSFTKAAALIPDDAQCQAEILRLRKNLWIPLQLAAADLLQGQNYDSALVLLRKSNVIYRDDPGSYLNMASAFMGLQQEDSAAAMYRLAAHAGTAADRDDLRRTAAYNAARMLQRNNHLLAAESAYREYLVMKPRDVDAKGALAGLLTQLGRPQEAAAIYDSLMANADSLDSFGLFSVGVALFRQANADSAAANAARRKATFLSSARAFELGLHKNPANRDALFNLTNTYLAAGDTAHVLEAAQRLVAADSMSRQSLTLLARAFQMNRRANDVVATLMRRDSLPFEVAIMRFDPRDSTASLRGGVMNLKSRERAGFPLALEFLNERGEVVASETVDIPTLGPAGNPGSMYDFNIQARARGIVAFRYKVH